MDNNIITLESMYCSKGIYCYQCRNDRLFREYLLYKQLVKTVDFVCVYRNLSFNCKFDDYPIETQEYMNRNERTQNNRKNAPDAIKSIRKALMGNSELLKKIDILEELIFPNGIVRKCIYQTVTDEKIKVKGCSCRANVIKCSNEFVIKDDIVLTTRDCAKYKCKYYKSVE